MQQAEVRRQYRVVLEMLKYELKLEKWLRTIEVSCTILWLQMLLYMLRETREDTENWKKEFATTVNNVSQTEVKVTATTN